MILRTAVVRHGRRTLASSMSRCAPRQLSTEAKPEGAPDDVAVSSRELPDWGEVKLEGVPFSSRLPQSSKKKRQKILQDVIMTLGADSVWERQSDAWTRLNQFGTENMTPEEQYAEFRRVQWTSRSLGSRLQRRYIPSKLIDNPPVPEKVTLELLMASQAHMGHNTSLWNPKNSRFIYGVRQGIHIIALETTAAYLRRAARVVEEVSRRGGIILFVGTRKGQMDIVTRAAELAGACHLFTRWTPGAITNRDRILKSHPLKVVDHLNNEIPGFELYKGEARPLVPDLVVCLNPMENYVLLHECGLKRIPTIGIIDTNMDPSLVTYTIPGNDDSLRATAVIAGVLGRAGQRGRRWKLEDAARGNVTWATTRDIKRYMIKEVEAALLKRKEAMKKLEEDMLEFTEEEKRLLGQQHQAVQLDFGEDDMMKTLGQTAVGQVDAMRQASLGEDAVVEEAHEAVFGAGDEQAQEARTRDLEAQLQSVPEQTAQTEGAGEDREKTG